MSNVQETTPDKNGHGNDPQTGPDVTIYVDDKPPVTIHRGNQTIAAIKEAAGVPAVDQLNLEGKDGGIIKLDQNGSFTIKGGEHFVSFRATGGSS
jgi:hypothetical protein